MNTAVCVLVLSKENYNFLSVSLKEDHEDFNLPGGKLENNESLEEAGIREVKEETGLDIFNLKFLYKDFDHDTEVFTYYTNDYQGKINTLENHVVKWLPIYNLTKSKKWPLYNTMIFNKYLELKL